MIHTARSGPKADQTRNIKVQFISSVFILVQILTYNAKLFFFFYTVLFLMSYFL